MSKEEYDSHIQGCTVARRKFDCGLYAVAFATSLGNGLSLKKNMSNNQ